MTTKFSTHFSKLKMTDVPEGHAALSEVPMIKRLMLEAFIRSAKTHCNYEGGASSSNAFNEPEKDKKTPKKRVPKESKKVEALKKKVANDKARYLKSMKEKKYLELLEKIEKQEKRIQKRKSLLQKDEDELQKLKEKLSNKSAE